MSVQNGLHTVPPVRPGKECTCCSKEFHLFRSKKNCYNCGYVVCESCSSYKTKLPKFGHHHEVRVCTYCANFLHVYKMDNASLSKLNIKTLRQYLGAYNISTQGMIEKQDLVKAIQSCRPIPEASELFFRANRADKPAPPPNSRNGTGSTTSVGSSSSGDSDGGWSWDPDKFFAKLFGDDEPSRPNPPPKPQSRTAAQATRPATSTSSSSARNTPHASSSTPAPSAGSRPRSASTQQQTSRPTANSTQGQHQQQQPNRQPSDQSQPQPQSRSRSTYSQHSHQNYEPQSQYQPNQTSWGPYQPYTSGASQSHPAGAQQPYPTGPRPAPPYSPYGVPPVPGHHQYMPAQGQAPYSIPGQTSHSVPGQAPSFHPGTNSQYPPMPNVNTGPYTQGSQNGSGYPTFGHDPTSGRQGFQPSPSYTYSQTSTTYSYGSNTPNTERPNYYGPEVPEAPPRSPQAHHNDSLNTDTPPRRTAQYSGTGSGAGTTNGAPNGSTTPSSGSSSSRPTPPQQARSPQAESATTSYTLDDIMASKKDPSTLTIKVLKAILDFHAVTYVGVVEKQDLVDRLQKLIDSTNAENARLREQEEKAAAAAAEALAAAKATKTNVKPTTPPVSSSDDANLCKICFEGPADTVLLNCNHLCSCLSCSQTIMDGSRLCPICREFVVKLLHVFRA